MSTRGYCACAGMLYWLERQSDSTRSAANLQAGSPTDMPCLGWKKNNESRISIPLGNTHGDSSCLLVFCCILFSEWEEHFRMVLHLPSGNFPGTRFGVELFTPNHGYSQSCRLETIVQPWFVNFYVPKHCLFIFSGDRSFSTYNYQIIISN